jgi:antitoxin HicB
MYPDYKKVIFPFKNKDGSITWVVEFPDLPGCSAVGKTEDQAQEEAKLALELWLDEYFEEHKFYPEPRETTGSFSGKLVLRLPKTLHKQLSQQAEDDGVSLNTLIITLLAENYIRCKSPAPVNITFSQATSNIETISDDSDYKDVSNRILKFPSVS